MLDRGCSFIPPRQSPCFPARRRGVVAGDLGEIGGAGRKRCGKLREGVWPRYPGGCRGSSGESSTEVAAGARGGGGRGAGRGTRALLGGTAAGGERRLGPGSGGIRMALSRKTRNPKPQKDTVPFCQIHAFPGGAGSGKETL